MLRNWLTIWCLALSLILFFIVSPLTRHGMFLDGVVYAAIAKNLSLGYGSIGHLFFSKTELLGFYEHPPLAIYLQSLFFKYLGSGFGVEQWYCAILAALQFVILLREWLRHHHCVATGYLLLIWGLIPLNHLYVNNFLEATLTVFTTITSFFYCSQFVRRTLPTRHVMRRLVINVMCVIGMLLAFFCNGPTAFFPIALPLLTALIDRNKRTMFDFIINTGCQGILLVLSFLLIYRFFPDIGYVITRYCEQQLFPAVIGTRQLDYIGFAHLHVVRLFFRGYMWAMIFAWICHQWAYRINRKRYPLMPLTKIWLGLSLISSLPVGVSHKQAFSYLMQSAPFFTLFIAESCWQPFTVIMAHIGSTLTLSKRFLMGSMSIFLLCCMFVMVNINGYNRDALMQKDVRVLLHYLDGDEILSISPFLFKQYYTGAYFARNALVSVTQDLGHRYYLMAKTEEEYPDNYDVIHLPLSYYVLLKQGNGTT